MDNPLSEEELVNAHDKVAMWTALQGELDESIKINSNKELLIEIPRLKPELQNLIDSVSIYRRAVHLILSWRYQQSQLSSNIAKKEELTSKIDEYESRLYLSASTCFYYMGKVHQIVNDA